jgi:hypothetical protein
MRTIEFHSSVKSKQQKSSRQKYWFTWILLGGIGAFFLYNVITKTYLNYKLAKEGESTVGRVVDVRRVGGKGIRRCSYVFHVYNGKYTGKVDDDVLELGDSLAVIYMPNNPEVNRAESDIR